VQWAHGKSCAKTGEAIEMQFRELTQVGPRNDVLEGVKVDESIRRRDRDENIAMRPFAKIL